MNTLPPILSLEGVSHRFGPTTALRDLTFDIPAGESIALFGANGAGKTTLLRILSTLLAPSRGRLHYRGAPLTRHARPAFRQRLGMVGHATFLYDELTAEENLLLHARLLGLDQPRSLVRDLLQRVGLADVAGQQVSRFSRGMQQRAALARALLAAPDLLLLDEPFTGLDPEGSLALGELLRERARAGTTVLMSIHDLRLGVELCDRYLILDRGRLQAGGACPPLRNRPGKELTLHNLAGSSP